jgi:hypothetical protein
MKSKLKLELLRWFYFVILFFLVSFFGVLIIGMFIAIPFLNWLLNDISYTLPEWIFVKRLAWAVVFIAFFAGTVTWCYEKRSSGR